MSLSESVVHRFKQPHLLLLLILILIPFCFQNWFNAPLVGRHAWAQADHFSISQKFGDHPNFFVPHSHNLAPDFMGEERTAMETGITRADFPLPHWVAGQAMKLSSEHQVLIARLVFYLFSAIGIWFFARALTRLTGRPWVSIGVTVAVFAGPLWLYYSNAIMPSTVSLTALLASLWSFGRLKQSGSDRDFMLTLGFLALSALLRPPSVVFGIAFGLYALESRMLRGSRRWVFTLLLGLACVGYAWHSVSLGREYGSLFLSSVNWGLGPMALIQTWSEGVSLHLSQAAPFLVVPLLGLSLALAQRRWNGPFLRAGLLATVLIFLYQILAAPQFVNHDYYLLDTLVPLGLVVLYFSAKAWSPRSWMLMVIGGTLSGLAWFNKGELYDREPQMSNEFDRVQFAFIASEGFMDEAGIQADERLLVLDAKSTNLPFIYLERDGYLVDFPVLARVEEVMGYPWDAVVIPRGSVQQDWVGEAGLPDKLQCVASNGLVNVYRRLEEKASVQGPVDFQGDFALQCEVTSSEIPQSSSEFPGEIPFVLPKAEPGASAIHLELSGIATPMEGNALLVVSAGDGYVQQELIPNQRVRAELVMPYDASMTGFNAYIWNPSKGRLSVDSLQTRCCFGFPMRR